MVRTSLLLVLCLGLLLPGVGGAAKKSKPPPDRWANGELVVHDRSGAAWTPAVAEAIDRFNALLPERAPRLIHRVEPAGPCGLHRVTRKRGVTVCLRDTGRFGAYADVTIVKRGRYWEGYIHLGEFGKPNVELVCHELNHVLFQSQHDPSWVDEKTCPFDDETAARLYGAH